MKKIIFVFLLGLMCFQTAKAQKQDTTAYYMKYGNSLAKSKEDADYLLIIFPADTSSGKVHYPVIEKYPNGNRKLIASSLTNDYRALKFDGTSISFDRDGHRESIDNYNNGKADGDFTMYYPNGRIYQTGKLSNEKLKLIECRDSTGKISAENGNGEWVYWDFKSKSITLHGLVKDSLKEGEWDGMDGDRVACVNIYEHGAFVSGTYYFKSGKKYKYHTDEVEPMFGNGGPAGFNVYLGQAVKFPDIDRKNGTQGKVIVTFVVEKDGSLTDVKALRGPDQSMMDAAIQAIQQSPAWLPGIQNGRPVRVQFTISFAFSLADKY
jgi:TonB family protein